jgi:cytochrome c553
LKPVHVVLAFAAALLAPAVRAQSALLQHPGRLLASGCFQCHGTNGMSGGFDTLAGDSREDLLNKLNEMRRKPPRDNIMNPHASGYTNEQLWQIADYFSKLPKP